MPVCRCNSLPIGGDRNSTALTLLKPTQRTANNVMRSAQVSYFKGLRSTKMVKKKRDNSGIRTHALPE